METHPKNLLIVEGDSTAQRALAILFRHRGWTVAIASTMEQGLRLIDRKPSYIILDLMLPDDQGESFIRTVKTTNPSVRVIVTTGCSDPSHLATVDQLLPYALLHKPLNFSKLFSVITAWNPGLAPRSGSPYVHPREQSRPRDRLNTEHHRQEFLRQRMECTARSHEEEREDGGGIDERSLIKSFKNSNETGTQEKSPSFVGTRHLPRKRSPTTRAASRLKRPSARFALDS